MKLKKLLYMIPVITLSIGCGNGNKTKNDKGGSPSGGGTGNTIAVTYNGKSYDISNKYKNIFALTGINYKLGGYEKTNGNIFHKLRHYVNGSYNIDINKNKDQTAADLVKELAKKLPSNVLKELLTSKGDGQTPAENVTYNGKVEEGIEQYHAALQQALAAVSN